MTDDAATVLIVDDNAMLVQLMSMLLTARFPEVRVATAGCCVEAIGRAGADPPSVAVVDCYLPDGDGVSLVAALEAMRPGVRVVLISGNAQSARPVPPELRHCVVKVLRKPFESEQLAQAVSQAFAAGSGAAPSSQRGPEARTDGAHAIPTETLLRAIEVLRATQARLRQVCDALVQADVSRGSIGSAETSVRSLIDGVFALTRTLPHRNDRAGEAS